MKTFATYLMVPAVCATLALGTTTRPYGLESLVRQERGTRQPSFEQEYGLPVLTVDAYDRITDSDGWEEQEKQYLELFKKDKHLISVLDLYLRASLAKQMEDGPRNLGLVLCYTLEEEAKQPAYRRHGNLPRLSKDVGERIARMDFGRLHAELRRIDGAMRRKDPLLYSILDGASQSSLTDEGERLPKEQQISIIASFVAQQVYSALQEAAREAAPKTTLKK